MNKERSKRNKTTFTNKKELWNVFETEINGSIKEEPLECIYRA